MFLLQMLVLFCSFILCPPVDQIVLRTSYAWMNCRDGCVVTEEEILRAYGEVRRATYFEENDLYSKTRALHTYR